ncbi:MAG: hypothetical protein MR408_07525 [Spirochaetia bacterium]|nr:hypothetical protein [Spirochaetia bacterium]
MKKLLISILALFALNSVFAGEFYSGDIQFLFGFGEDLANYSEGSFSSIKYDYKSTNLNLEVESWNIFKLGSIFGFGFMLSGEAGITKTTSITQTISSKDASIPEKNLDYALQWSALAGPAVAFSLPNTVRIGLSAGLSYEATSFAYKESSTNKIDGFAGFGWGINLNVKMFPDTPTSLVAGGKLLGTFPEKIYYGTNTSSIKMYEMDTRTVNDANNLYLGFYVGVACNW